jgi:hypothetical protein
MLLKAVSHQQLIASSWGLAEQLGWALPRHCPWGSPAQLHREPRRPRGRTALLKAPAAQQQSALQPERPVGRRAGSCGA